MFLKLNCDRSNAVAGSWRRHSVGIRRNRDERSKREMRILAANWRRARHERRISNTGCNARCNAARSLCLRWRFRFLISRGNVYVEALGVILLTASIEAYLSMTRDEVIEQESAARQIGR